MVSLSNHAVASLRALADPTRLAMARLLAEGAFSVGEVQTVLRVGQSTASRHLRILADAGLVGCRREGRLAFYHWRDTLPAAQEALRGFVRAHAAALDADARRRLHGVFEQRTERSRRFFDGPAAGSLASEKAAFAAGDAADEMLAWLPPLRTAADLGTGAGRQLARLRSVARRVVGVDASPRMLEGAAALVAREGWRDVELRLGALEHLPLRDGEIDGAFAHLVLHHAARPEAALAEALRALGPGGVLVVGEYLPHHEEWMREELADQWLGFEPAAIVRTMCAAGFLLAGWTSAGGAGPDMFVAAALKGGDAARRRWFEARLSGGDSGRMQSSRPARARRARPAQSRRPGAVRAGKRR